jgi:Tfp pilus assembly PilM family ATPase
MKAIQLVDRGTSLHLHAALSIPRVDASTLQAKDIERLIDAMERQNFKGSEVTIACPPGVVHTDLLELPPRSSGVPIEQITRVEIQRSGRFDAKPFEMAFWELPSTARSGAATNVMAVAVKDDDIAPILSTIESCGLDVAAMETNGTALARLFSSSAPDAVHSIVDCGASASSLILVHAGVVIYKRRLSESSFDLLRRSIADELELDEVEVDSVLQEHGVKQDGAQQDQVPQVARLRGMVAQHLDALSDEIESSLAYAAHRYPQLRASDVALTGGGAGIAEIDRYIGRRLSIDVRVIRPAEFVQFAPQHSEMAVSPVMLTALGLAMNEAD